MIPKQIQSKIIDVTGLIFICAAHIVRKVFKDYSTLITMQSVQCTNADS